MSGSFLEAAHVDRFGAWSNKTVGPFSPRLSVVFGRNEAGKTTFAAFVGGVLFGWEEARAENRNTYKPEDADRSGFLLFANEGGDQTLQEDTAAVLDCDAEDSSPARGVVKLRRVRNADGLQGDTSILEDIDEGTYRTMFSLTSDELLSLRDTDDMTSRLLTAESGTSVSPAEALAQIDGQITGFTSRSETADRSIARLDAEIEKVRCDMAAAGQEAQRFCEQNKELRELEPRREALNEQIGNTSTAIEHLSSCRAGIEKIDAETASLEENGARSREEEHDAEASWRKRRQACTGDLASISDDEDLVLRDKIDALVELESRQTRMIDAARDKFNESNAALEVIEEAHQDGSGDAGEGTGARRGAFRRTARLVAVTVMFVVLLGLGIWLFVQGRAAGSLSYTVLGAILVLIGALLAVGVLVVAVRPPVGERHDEDEERRAEEARQIMLRDKRKLEMCLADEEGLASRIEDELAEAGLGTAGSSLRRARAILDEARDVRAKMALDEQHRRDSAERAEEAARRMADLERQRASLYEEEGVDSAMTVADMERAIARLDGRRGRLQEESEVANRRRGELTQSLSQARQSHELDFLKNRHQELKVRRNEATRDLARLLLARRMLEGAIGSWKAKSQPEVYEQASRLLALMTDGRWVRVDMLPDGMLRVTDKTYGTCGANKLSTATCQQLYLSLRIALLMCADAVGRSVPVIADDILVNFDAQRRAGAAQALVELSRTRQVIVLTCHEEVVSAMKEADESAAVIEL